MHQNSIWREVIGVVVLLFFAGYGIAHVIYPDKFMKTWHRGGEMLTGWNRFGIQIAGAIFAGFAIYVLYSLFRG
jgi:uncharacterized membrane protein